MTRLGALAGSFLVLTTFCTVIWSFFVEGRLYQCTDEVGFDYLFPGHWVHGRIAVVSQIPKIFSTSDPDMVKAGWSVARLWMLWSSFFGASVFLSLLLVFIPWHRPSTPNHALQPSAGAGGRCP